MPAPAAESREHAMHKRTVATVVVLAALVVAGCGGTDDTLADNPNPTLGPAVTQQAAVDAALQATPGELVEVLVATEDGVATYDVRVRRDDGVLVRTLVSQNTGAVIVSEQLLDDGRVPNDSGLVDLP
jgi:uncharacterized membrane protein YkoI